MAVLPLLVVLGIALAYLYRLGNRSIEADRLRQQGIPIPTPAPNTEPSDLDRTVRCPCCGETILAIAQKM
jgi:hypothetical protein